MAGSNAMLNAQCAERKKLPNEAIKPIKAIDALKHNTLSESQKNNSWKGMGFSTKDLNVNN